MPRTLDTLILAACLVLSVSVSAQEPVKPNPDHAKMLQSSDPHLAANKRLVYDLWRKVLEAGHLELADQYMTENYIQHNPTVATGRAAFVAFFSKFLKPKPIQDRVQAPLVSIVAENDMVVLSFVREENDPNPGKKYTSTWFDMFRIEGGKVAEHWDTATKR